MKTLAHNSRDRHVNRMVKTAQEVMMANPLSISRSAAISDAAKFLTAHRISAAPVIDEAGRPVGVLSRTDIVRHTQCDSSAESRRQHITVGEIMTPVVYFVRPETSLTTVIDDLLGCMVHRLFVVDDHGVLIGVISTLDVLRSLHSDATVGSRLPAKSVA
ncbi:MAG: CBS domain-containing protein [Planctomycetes bacterium]|nr:CBS domain-containing protein [Planctomycetota bacterium]